MAIARVKNAALKAIPSVFVHAVTAGSAYLSYLGVDAGRLADRQLRGAETGCDLPLRIVPYFYT